MTYSSLYLKTVGWRTRHRLICALTPVVIALLVYALLFYTSRHPDREDAIYPWCAAVIALILLGRLTHAIIMKRQDRKQE